MNFTVVMSTSEKFGSYTFLRAPDGGNPSLAAVSGMIRVVLESSAGLDEFLVYEDDPKR